MYGDATPEVPIYRKVEEGKGYATKVYMIVCDEGWRESIVCTGMYGWAADWLLAQIQGKPYAAENRPDATPRDVPSGTIVGEI